MRCSSLGVLVQTITQRFHHNSCKSAKTSRWWIWRSRRSPWVKWSKQETLKQRVEPWRWANRFRRIRWAYETKSLEFSNKSKCRRRKQRYKPTSNITKPSQSLLRLSSSTTRNSVNSNSSSSSRCCRGIPSVGALKWTCRIRWPSPCNSSSLSILMLTYRAPC